MIISDLPCVCVSVSSAGSVPVWACLSVSVSQRLSVSVSLCLCVLSWQRACLFGRVSVSQCLSVSVSQCLSVSASQCLCVSVSSAGSVRACLGVQRRAFAPRDVRAIAVNSADYLKVAPQSVPVNETFLYR